MAQGLFSSLSSGDSALMKRIRRTLRRKQQEIEDEITLKMYGSMPPLDPVGPRPIRISGASMNFNFTQPSKMNEIESLELTIEAWSYLALHPEIRRKEQLPSEIRSKIRGKRYECPLCEHYMSDRPRFFDMMASPSERDCGSCPLNTEENCFDKKATYQKWFNSDANDEKTRRKCAIKIVKKCLKRLRQARIDEAVAKLNKSFDEAKSKLLESFDTADSAASEARSVSLDETQSDICRLMKSGKASDVS